MRSLLDKRSIVYTGADVGVVVFVVVAAAESERVFKTQHAKQTVKGFGDEQTRVLQIVLCACTFRN